MSKPLPEEIIVKPQLGPLNPQNEDDDRDMVTGHIISGPPHYIFEASGSTSIFYEYPSGVRAWLSEHGYQHRSDLKNGYLATPGLHGIYSRG